MSSPVEVTQNRQPVIQCDSVYKIFGENAKKMLQGSKGNVDAKTFQDAGCIVGVNNASFAVQKGDLLVVMGLSGSGKSTLLRCISRLTDATSGNIYIDGEDLLGMSNKSLLSFGATKWAWSFRALPYYLTKLY
jgi:ABC-type proline/glycine betaine transport system, ATPase component